MYPIFTKNWHILLFSTFLLKNSKNHWFWSILAIFWGGSKKVQKGPFQKWPIWKRAFFNRGLAGAKIAFQLQSAILNGRTHPKNAIFDHFGTPFLRKIPMKSTLFWALKKGHFWQSSKIAILVIFDSFLTLFINRSKFTFFAHFWPFLAFFSLFYINYVFLSHVLLFYFLLTLPYVSYTSISSCLLYFTT